MFYQVLKAFIWKNVYANVNSMFDVSGENLEADNASNKQKAMLVDKFEKMEFQKTCDKIIDYALIYGELISFSTWKKRQKNIDVRFHFLKHYFRQTYKNCLRFWRQKQKVKVTILTKKLYMITHTCMRQILLI